jgi:hypothetical protein
VLVLARVVVIICGLLLVGFGLWIAAYGNEGQAGLVIVGLLTAVTGVGLIAVLAFERMRYRSVAGEVPPTVGPPGGEASGEPIDPRFRPTDEVFIDPTSGQTMRVFADPASGERRYRSVNDGPGD